MPANYVAGGWMWPKIKLIQFFIGVLVTCKNEQDPIKNEGARVVTTLSGHGIVPVNMKNYCLGISSVTHEIAKHRQLLRI